MQIIVTDEAAWEIEEAAQWYEERSERAKERFLEEIRWISNEIAKTPTRFMRMKHDHGLRRALMKRYPYLVLFREVDESTIHIVTVKHEKRHPDYGIDR